MIYIIIAFYPPGLLGVEGFHSIVHMWLTVTSQPPKETQVAARK